MGPDSKYQVDAYVKHVTILDYGHYWYSVLRECIEIKKLKLKETAEVLKCTATTVKNVQLKSA